MIRMTELKARHCSGCLRTVNLVYAGGDEARCPECSRRFVLGRTTVHDMARQAFAAASEVLRRPRFATLPSVSGRVLAG